MNEVRANSSPNLASALTNSLQQEDDSSLEGVAAPIQLLLKLIQDHKDACGKGKTDSRRMLRVATMMSILDNVRERVQKCQAPSNKKPASLRRCNTDLRPNHPPRDKKPGGEVDEKEKLRRELAACMTARKCLEMMCSSLGKEKEIMAAELSKKVHELNEMEEHLNSLRAQNDRLIKKVQECALNHGQEYNDTDGDKEKELNETEEENEVMYGESSEV